MRNASWTIVVGLFLSSNGVASPCSYPGSGYSVQESRKLRLSEPEVADQLVGFTTASGYVIFAKQVVFIDLVTGWSEKYPNQTDIVDLKFWVEELRPSPLINLDNFGGDHSGKRQQFMIDLASRGDVYIFSNSRRRYLDAADFEVFACIVDDYATDGGRLLRTKDGNAIDYTLDWAS